MKLYFIKSLNFEMSIITKKAFGAGQSPLHKSAHPK